MAFLYLIKGRKIYYLLLDALIIYLSYVAAYLLRFYPEFANTGQHMSSEQLLLLGPAYLFSYYFLQIYRIMWTYSNIKDVYRLMLANISGFFIFLSVISYLNVVFSRMIFTLSFMFISGATIFYRIMLRDYFSRSRYESENNSVQDFISNENKKERKRILVVGAGEAGRIILSEFVKTGRGKQIVGFIDDDPDKAGRMFNGKMIFYNTSSIGDVIYKFGITEIIIAMPSAPTSAVSRVVSDIKREVSSMPIKILPPYIELSSDKNLAFSLRDISISDLIGREEFQVDRKLIREKFSGKTVLITGAGGSIGSEICRQLLRFDVKKIIACGRGEFSIYNLIKELNRFVAGMENGPEIHYRIVNVTDRAPMEKVFSEFRPHIVFHAAAHKHVPLMEFNEAEAVSNNVGGTFNVLNLSCDYGAGEFVMVSTDKAVNPVNVMGATKRAAELLVGYFNKNKNLKTVIVRFGNVIGSRGSVIPLFKEQIEKGGPVTVTHPDIERYFMSIPEASLLVISASANSRGGELFVLDMGKQYKITDIAGRLISLYGLTPGRDIRIEFTGLRPGEKLYEELFYCKDGLEKTDNNKIFMLKSENDGAGTALMENFIEKELPSVFSLNSLQIREMLARVVPEYNFSDWRKNSGSNIKLVN